MEPTFTENSGPRNNITVTLEPEMKTLVLEPRPKTVKRMLEGFSIKPTACLVILESRVSGGWGAPKNVQAPLQPGERRLLTPDLQIMPGDVLTIRKVTSSG